MIVTTIWPGSIRLSSSWSAAASVISVARGVPISRRTAASSSRITSSRRGAGADDIQQVANLLRDVGEFGLNLVALKAGEALQPEVEDAARLSLGQLYGAGFGDRIAAILDEGEERQHVFRRPVPLHQREAGGGGVGGPRG